MNVTAVSSFTQKFALCNEEMLHFMLSTYRLKFFFHYYYVVYLQYRMNIMEFDLLDFFFSLSNDEASKMHFYVSAQRSNYVTPSITNLFNHHMTSIF